MVKLDDYFLVEKIDLIKVDVEGCEIDVLQGAKCLIKKFKPIILIENMTELNIEDKILKELEGLDYISTKLSYQNTIFISTDNLNYDGMYNWVHDLPINRNCKQKFLDVLSLIKDKKDCKVLEVGVNRGTSLIHILKNLHQTSIGTAIYIWKDQNVLDVCLDNIKTSGMEDRIRILKGDSTDRLIELIKKEEKFHFIYVDGSHTLCDTYSDCLLSWQLLEKDGIMAIDDYTMAYDEKESSNILDLPFEGVNKFLEKYKSDYIILDKDYRVFLQKIN